MVGEEDKKHIVMNWLIDDGVSNRANRDLIIDDRFEYVAVGCQFHKKFGLVTFANFFGKDEQYEHFPENPLDKEKWYQVIMIGQKIVKV